MGEFTEEWMKEEINNLNSEELNAYSKFLIQILLSNLVYINKMKINTIEDYYKIKKEIIKDIK